MNWFGQWNECRKLITNWFQTDKAMGVDSIEISFVWMSQFAKRRNVRKNCTFVMKRALSQTMSRNCPTIRRAFDWVSLPNLESHSKISFTLLCSIFPSSSHHTLWSLWGSSISKCYFVCTIVQWNNLPLRMRLRNCALAASTGNLLEFDCQFYPGAWRRKTRRGVRP